MNSFCTIITKSYLPYARVLHNSIQRHLPGIHFRFLIVDDDPGNNLAGNADPLFSAVSLAAVLKSNIAQSIFDKYAHTNNDFFRWAMKPILLLYLLDSYKKVIFVDPDIYFTGDPSFLFQQLNDHSILLSPQWSEVDPLKYEDGLFTVLRNGLYTGAFVGATSSASVTLEWWAKVCHFKMDKQKDLGVFVDQKYLDLFPLLNENTAIIRHPGCNLTNINLLTCVRSLVNGVLKINKLYDPIFIHFTHDTRYNILRGNDPLLQDILRNYYEELGEAGLQDPGTVHINPLLRVKQNLRIRTRVKRFLFHLSEKL